MKKIFAALSIEIKNTIFKSFFHTLRFGGLLLMPLLYGFSYIFAFYDPFEHTANLQIAVITQKYETTAKITVVSEFEKALIKQMEKTSTLKTGDLNMEIKVTHKYIDAKLTKKADIDAAIAKIDRDNYASIYVPRLSAGTKLGELIKKIADANISVPAKISALQAFVASVSSSEKIQISNNYKKNYLIAFGIDIGSGMSGGRIFALGKIIDTLRDSNFIQYLKQQKLISTPVSPKVLSDFEIIMNGLHDAIAPTKVVNGKTVSESFEAIHIDSQMGDKAKYGYGLAPFFISVSMWIGGMVMTFAVHKKIYERETMPGIRYLAKWLLITFGTVIQASLLMGSLYFIGFDKLGIDNWSYMFMYAIFIGIVFSAIIQAIRFLIPNRNFGIFIIIILLVLQMSAGGGLFPIETQSAFYKTIHNILPMSHSIALLRQLAYNPDWMEVLRQIGFLMIYLLIVPFAVVGYHHQTVRKYEQNGWVLPEKLLKRRERHKARITRNKKAGYDV